MKEKSVQKTELKIVKFEELNWKQIEALDKNKTIFFLPIGPLEEHGPHLPVGTDLMTIRDAVIEAIKVLSKKRPDLTFILMPEIPLGYCKFNTDFPGSISVSGKVVKDIVYSVGSSLGNYGFKYMIICTYHMAIGHLKGIYSAMQKLESKYAFLLLLMKLFLEIVFLYEKSAYKPSLLSEIWLSVIRLFSEINRYIPVGLLFDM